MLKLGERQTLKIDHRKSFGVYLGEGNETVLLPGKEVPEDTEIGDELNVFLYRDSSDRLVATMREPKITLHETKLLRVKEVTKIGAFLDWGLEKDLLLPYHEQTKKVKADEEVLVSLYIDKSSRLCATMNVYPYLRTDSPYQADSEVTGRIYQTSGNFGVFVAVDDRYSALIPAQEAAGHFRIGDVITARVTRVLPDGKLNLSVRKKAYQQLDEDAETVLKVIDEYEGVLPFDDKVSPEIIRREMGLSKNAFKRAVGHLMKEGRAEIRGKRIYRV
ncbi:CvfB family protein [Porcincola intestinalis]|uniref:CvfB family protein n=1 Tax=Porcincola intestinalis TaxID=2606632 RepID=UPI0023EF9E33|nr:S1-like domain-containing RNA-binding protein [Porcincola intestinalis]MCI6767579.1 S1-like domain-containing RNA-binding protein [Lachnospiraceae bacterium]MDD7059709.1 S1-like domain-containing RNA-binding protein [Porcincola intestinalis]MDY5283142.1 S1-like domain-containing RNA-binding protein [Porcincola intestinalis]MDY5578390.1 S1-like domain-containing RNA-binding protein [Porcincola intestinalis]